MNRLISCVRTFKDLYYVIIRENKKVEGLRCVPILFEYAKTIESLSMNFHNISIDMSLTDNDILSVFDASQLVTLCYYCQNWEDMDIKMIVNYHCIISLILIGMNLMKTCR